MSIPFLVSYLPTKRNTNVLGSIEYNICMCVYTYRLEGMYMCDIFLFYVRSNVCACMYTQKKITEQEKFTNLTVRALLNHVEDEDGHC